MKRVIIISISILAVILIIAGIYFTWFFQYNCTSMECFQAHQVTCSKANVIRQTDSTTWAYTIKGTQNNLCVIQATVLKVKEGQADRLNLQGSSMDCSLTIGSKAFPESDLDRCHGILKEEIQQIIITNAHAQILANIGKVSGQISVDELENITV